MVLARGIMATKLAANVAEARGQSARLETHGVSAGFVLSRLHGAASPCIPISQTHTSRASRAAFDASRAARRAQARRGAMTSFTPHQPRGPGVHISAEGGVRARGDPMP